MSDDVWLLRHAETEWSRNGRHTGRTDIPLTESGQQAALALRARLDGHRFSLVLCSPLARARTTAELSGLGERANLDDDLMEWDYGDYEGLTTPEIREQRPDWDLWQDGAPGGESPDDIGARCDRVVARLRASEGEAAVVAHGHVLRVLAARWVAEPASFGGRLHLDTGALSVLGHERETPVISRWNMG